MSDMFEAVMATPVPPEGGWALLALRPTCTRQGCWLAPTHVQDVQADWYGTTHRFMRWWCHEHAIKLNRTIMEATT